MSDSTPDAQTLLRRLDEAMERIDKLEAENARLRKRVKELEGVEQENVRLRKRVQRLEHKLHQDSSNSHRPPSTDDPWADDDDDDDGRVMLDFGKQRSQGAQPGHQGHHRQLADADEVDKFVEVRPDECDGCGHRLTGEDIAPWRHQIWDIEVSKTLVEYRMHRLECDRCSATQRAELPEGVTHSNFGDRLASWVGYLSGRFDLSKRDVEQLVEEGFGIPISLGSVCTLERRAQRALAPAWREAVELLDASEVLWVDETGWFQSNERNWMWVAVGDDNTEVTVFRIADSRSRQALRQLVSADFDGIVTSDRYGAYNGREPKKRQICWQHLVRDFRGLVARDGPGAKAAGQMLLIAQLIFWTLGRIEQGKYPPEKLRRRIDEAWAPAVNTILERGDEPDNAPAIFGNLKKRQEALWNVAFHDDVEPTNNRAERAVRPAVIKRKLSFGTQSGDGSRFIERMLTVCESLRRQSRAVLDFIADSIVARRTGRIPPALARPG